MATIGPTPGMVSAGPPARPPRPIGRALIEDPQLVGGALKLLGQAVEDQPLVLRKRHLREPPATGRPEELALALRDQVRVQDRMDARLQPHGLVEQAHPPARPTPAADGAVVRRPDLRDEARRLEAGQGDGVDLVRLDERMSDGAHHARVRDHDPADEGPQQALDARRVAVRRAARPPDAPLSRTAASAHPHTTRPQPPAKGYASHNSRSSWMPGRAASRASRRPAARSLPNPPPDPARPRGRAPRAVEIAIREPVPTAMTPRRVAGASPVPAIAAGLVPPAKKRSSSQAPINMPDLTGSTTSRSDPGDLQFDDEKMTGVGRKGLRGSGPIRKYPSTGGDEVTDGAPKRPAATEADTTGRRFGRAAP